VKFEHANLEAYWISVQPGDGTRYNLHIVEDRYGGWLVIWKEAKEMYWVNKRLDEIKPIVPREYGTYNEKMILDILNECVWIGDV